MIKKIVQVGYQSYQQCKISEKVSNVTKIPNPQFKAKPTSCTSVLTTYPKHCVTTRQNNDG